MPWYTQRNRHGKDITYWVDPIKIREGRGLNRVMREPMAWWLANNFKPIMNVPTPRYIDKWDLFAEYPYLEEIDYNRLQYETARGIKARNDEWVCESQKLEWSSHWEYCCWPMGCLHGAAIGSTLHWQWRAAFEKQLPYWADNEHPVLR